MNRSLVAVVEPRPGVRWVQALRQGSAAAPRAIAAFTFVCGLVSVISALLPAERKRLRVVTALLGPSVPSLAAGTAAAVGVALMLLSFGLRRRQQKAWVATVLLASGAGVLHLVKGLDVEEAALCCGLVAALVSCRPQFRAARTAPGRRAGLALLVGLCSVDVALGALLLRANDETVVGSPRTGAQLRHILLGFAGVRGPLRYGDDMTAHTIAAVLAGLGAVTLLAGVAVLLARPPGAPARAPEQDAALAALLASHGEQDSLAWFAGRDDRPLILSPSGKAAVSFRVVANVALAAGDPLGDPEAWPAAIDAFLAESAAAAWVPAVMGCSERGARAWARAGLDVLELGEEAVVDTAEFRLDGRAMRGVRQACGRVERAGYRLSVRRAAEIGAAEWAEVTAAAGRWRKGPVERGFSMALGRLGDPRDGAGMVATARDADGQLRALLQFVPWGRHGLSLDVMRRDPVADNGVNEALIVALLQQCAGLGIERLSLNFAVFHSALDYGGRLGAGPVARAWRRVLVVGSRWWQIEQLARFNAKFAPRWVPRFLCYPGPLELVGVGIAAMRAEAFLVLPGDSRRSVRIPAPAVDPDPGWI